MGPRLALRGISMADVRIAVNGTLMRGLELNANLTGLGATFICEAKTDNNYRLWSIGDRHPAMIRGRRGANIDLELWELPAESLSSLLEKEPPGLCAGRVTLSDGSTVLGILGEPHLVRGQKEITQYGGWRPYASAGKDENASSFSGPSQKRPNAILPTVPFGGHQITRLILGGNPLCGNSHLDEARNLEMREYFTPEQVVETMLQCGQAGINTVQARGDYHRILHWIELFRRKGGRLHWIVQTASEMHDVFQNIRIIAAADPIAIYHHGTQTDRFWHDGCIDKTEDYLKCMRDQGVLVGLGTHIPEVIEYAEEKNWDVDFYMACAYNLSQCKRQSAFVSAGKAVYREEYLESDREAMCAVVKQTSRTCLLFKILAAGRKCDSQNQVSEAFQFAFENIKPQDAVIVGMFPKHENQVQLNVQHTLRALDPTSK